MYSGIPLTVVSPIKYRKILSIFQLTFCNFNQLFLRSINYKNFWITEEKIKPLTKKLWNVFKSKQKTLQYKKVFQILLLLRLLKTNFISTGKK